MSQLYTKQEISELMNLSYKTLRVYEEKGLITPIYINPQNGYKYYSEDQIYTIYMIRYSNFELDISLAEIKEILGESNQQYNLIQMLEEKKANAQAMVKKYQQIVDNIEHSLSYNSLPIQLYHPYIEQMNHIFYYQPIDAIPSFFCYWNIAQDFYNYLGDKRINFTLQKINRDVEILSKIGIASESPIESITSKFKQDILCGTFLCVQFVNFEKNYTIALDKLENFAEENNLTLDLETIYLQYHAVDISSLRLEESIASLKIKIKEQNK